jgi:hypothetical protein
MKTKEPKKPLIGKMGEAITAERIPAYKRPDNGKAHKKPARRAFFPKEPK